MYLLGSITQQFTICAIVYKLDDKRVLMHYHGTMFWKNNIAVGETDIAYS